MSWVDDYKKDMGVQDTGVTQPTGPKKINWTEDYKNDAQAGALESVTAQPKTSWMPDLGNLISEDSPVNMMLTQQNLNEMGGTVKDLGKLVMRPSGIVEGLMEFGSAMPGFLTGLVGAGQGLAKDIALAPEASIKHNYDAALQGFQREASKFPAWDSGRPETKLVGRTMMAPFEAIQGPLHTLANSDFINNIPLVGEDVSGLLKFLGDAAGLITQHGMSVRGKVYDPKIKLFKEKAEKGTLTEADKVELTEVAKQLTEDVDKVVAEQGTKPAADPLARLDEAYKPEPPQQGARPTGEPTHTFVSNRGNEYVKIDGSWYNKDSYTKVTNKFIVQAAEAKSKTIDAKPTPETLTESHQLARKESETTKALHEARTGAEARRTVNEELQLELERARKGEVKPVEVSEEPKPKETKPVVELDPTADDYIAQAFKNRETEVKTGKAEKRSIRARLTKARRDGEIKRGDAVRFTTIDELLDLLRTKPGEKLRNTSETGEIHATPIMGEKGETFTAYGSYEKHSVAVVVPREHTVTKKGSTTVEVLVNPETPIDKLRFVIGKDKRLLTADQVKQELLKLKKEEPKVEPKVETKVEPEAEPVFEPIEIEPEPKAEVKPEAKPTVESAPTAIKLQKGEEPPKTSAESKVPEFPKEALKDLEDSEKPKSAKKNQVIEVDGVEEYDIVSKEYESFEGAQRAAEKSPQLAKRRKELAETGASLEVVKIGDKFRVAERLSLTEVERQAIMEALEGSEKTTVVDPELAMERLKAIAPDVVKWHKGDTSIPIDTLMDEVASLVEGSKGKTDPLMAEVVTAADKMLTLVKEKQQEQFLPKRSGDLFVAKSEKNPNLDIVLNKEGQPFEEMFDALAYMQEHKLQGVVNDAAGGKGFVIELRKPTSLVRTKRETLVDIKGILGELEKEDLADLGKVESSKPKGQGKRKIVEPIKVESEPKPETDLEPVGKSIHGPIKDSRLKSEVFEVFDIIGEKDLKKKRKFSVNVKQLREGERAEVHSTWHDGTVRFTAVRGPDGKLRAGEMGSYDTIMIGAGAAKRASGIVPAGHTMYIVDLGPWEVRDITIYRSGEKMHGVKPVERKALPQSETKTWYIDKADMDKLAWAQVEGGPKLDLVEILDKPGKVGLKYLSGPDKGKVEPSSIVSVKDAPTENLVPIKLSEDGRTLSFGKPVTAKEILKSESGETSIFTDMWGWVFGKNKRPTLSVAEFQKMSGQRIDSLRRLSKDAMDRRITVEALAKQLGFDETQARYIQALAEDVMRYVKRNVSYHDTEAFKSGEVANGGPTNWQHKKTKEQLWVPEISQGELAELKAANVIDKGLTGGFTREWLPTVHAVNDFKSPLVRALHRDSQRLQVQVDKDIRTLRRTLATKQKNAGKGSGDRIYLRALWEQADLRERMEAGGFTEADIPKLTPKEQEVYDWMRAEYELAYPEINDVRAHIGKRRMRYTPNYMTLFFAEGWASKAGHASNCVLDSWDTMTNRVVQFRKTKFDFSKTRSKKKALSQISENAYDVFSRYMEQKIRFTTMSPLISKIAQMNKGLKDGVVHYKTKKGEAKTKPKIFMLKNKNPVLSEFLNRWSNHLAGKDIDAVLHLSDTTSNRFWEKLTRKISGNIAVTTLGFLFRTVLIQASALKNTAVVAGFPYTALGVLETLRPKTFRETLKESGLVEYRRGETILEDWYKYTEKGGYEGLKRASMALLQYMDVKTAAASYRAFKRYGLKELKLKEKEARKYADEMVTQTQASALPGDIAPVQRSTLGKAITLFQTFTINDWAFMYKEAFGIDRALTKKERAKRMVALAIGTVMFTSLYEDALEINSPFPTPFRTAYRLRDMDVPLTDKLKVIGKEILEPVPGVGGAARYGSHPLGIAVDLAGQVFKSISGDQTARPFWETAGRFAPLPGLGQSAKSLHGHKRGADFWEILMGQPPEKQKILGRTPGRKTVKY